MLRPARPTALARAARLAALALALAATACTSYQDVAPGAVVTCDANADCPAGRICNRSRCILPADLGTPPDLVLLDGKLAVTPPTGRAGTVFTVTVQATKELEAPPRVILSLDALVELPCAATAGRTYACTYTATGAERGGLGGHVTIDVRMVDVVGQEAAKNGVGGFDLDFAPPVLAARSVAPERVPLGGVVQVFFTTDEELGASPVLVASRPLDEPGGDGRHFTLTRQPGTRNYLFTHLVTTGDASGPLAFSVDLADAVGNATTAVAVGGVTVDTVAPAISSLSVAPARIRDTGTVTLTFDASEEAATLAASVGGLPMTCGAYQPASPRYTCTRAMVGNEIAAGTEAAQTVIATLTDGAGNRSTASGSTVFDFRPPAVASAAVAYLPAATNPLPSVSEAARGTTVRVTVTSDEPLDTAVGPELVATAGATPLGFVAVSTSSTGATFDATIPAGASDGSWVPTLRWRDVAGNAAAIALAQAPIRVRVGAPSLTVDQGAVTFLRSPWGSGAPEDLGGFVIPAGAWFGLAPHDPLSPVARLPASAFSFGDRPVARVHLWADGNRQLFAGRADPAADGTWPRQQLSDLDTAGLWVSGIDAAGNESQLVRIATTEWVATPRASPLRANPGALLTSGYAPGAIADAEALRAPADAGADAPDGAAVLARAETKLRRATSATQPSPRTRASVVLDPVRGRLVVYGGGTNSGTQSYRGELSDVWELEGATWRDVTPPLSAQSPGIFADAGAVYDSARGRMVVVTPDGRTWEWDGEAWEDRTPLGANPSPRRFAAMAYDADRGVVVLFGGDDCTGLGYCSAGPVLGDTWEWDGLLWTRRSVGGGPNDPPARSRAAAAYAPGRGLVMFAGQTTSSTDWPGAAQLLGDLWQWNGSGWAPVTQSGTPPARRVLAALACGPSSCLLFGGMDPLGGSPPYGSLPQALPPETYTLSGGTWTRLSPPAPLPSGRYQHALVYDPTRGRYLMATGYTAAYAVASDLWEWTGSAWVDRRATPAPSPRDRPAMAYDESRGRVVVFGDSGAADGRHVWEWDGTRWYDFAPTDPTWPSTRSGAAMAYDGTNHRVLLFGGRSYLNDLWSWNGSGWTNHVPQGATLGSTTQPAGRSAASMVWDPANARLVLFGGQGAQGAKQDTWIWTGGSAFTQLFPATSPQPRDSAGMVYAGANQVVMFGGAGSGGDRADTWIWNGTTWQEQIVAGPLARRAPAMSYDPMRSRVVLLGGSGFTAGTNYADLWEWDGGGWTERVGTRSVTTLQGHQLAWDTYRNRGVVFGGTAYIGREPIPGEVWELDADVWRRPAVTFEAAGGAAGIDPAQVTGVRVRWRAGATYGPYSPASVGAALYAWITTGSGGQWAFADRDPEGLAAGQPWLGSAGARRTWDAAGTGRQHVHGREARVTVRVVPDGPSAAGDSSVALDAVEVRVRYTVPP